MLAEFKVVKTLLYGAGTASGNREYINKKKEQ